MTVHRLEDHLDYLKKTRDIADATVQNYSYAMKRVGITEVDTDSLPALWTKLDSMLPVYDGDGNITSGIPYGYVHNFQGLVCGLLSLRGINYDSYEHNVFRERLGKLMRNSPEAYTDEQLRLILSKSRRGRTFGLYRTLLFLAYTGCRISSAHGVKFSDLKEVPNYPKVMSVMVVGKGHQYPAIISKKAVEHIRFHNYEESDTISGYKDDTMKSSFAKYNNSLLTASIESSGIDIDRSKTDATRSIRKWFTLRLANDGIDGDSLTLLLGQIPQSTAYKIYATSKGSTTERLIQKEADSYSKSSLSNLELW